MSANVLSARVSDWQPLSCKTIAMHVEKSLYFVLFTFYNTFILRNVCILQLASNELKARINNSIIF